VEACRCAVVLVLELLVVVTLSFVGTDVSGLSVHAGFASTLAFGTLTLLVMLVVAGILGLDDIAPAGVERVRAAVAGALRAVVVLLGLSIVAPLITEMAMQPAGANVAWGSVLLLLPNLAIMALLFGLGVPVSTGLSGLLSGNDSGGSVTVFDLAAG